MDILYVYLLPLPTTLGKFIRYLPYGLPFQKEIIQNEEPLILAQSPPNSLGQFLYKRKYSPYRCPEDDEYKYPWGQPAVYNRAALERILSGLQQNGLVK